MSKMFTSGKWRMHGYRLRNLRGIYVLSARLAHRLRSVPVMYMSKPFYSVYSSTYNRHLPSAVAYGMTETSPAVSHMVKGSSKYESVGGPIPNTEMKVVNPETRNSLPARQTGEICMRGPQVREIERDLSSFVDFHTWIWRCYFMWKLLLPLSVGSHIVLTSPNQQTAQMFSELSKVID